MNNAAGHRLYMQHKSVLLSFARKGSQRLQYSIVLHIRAAFAEYCPFALIIVQAPYKILWGKIAVAKQASRKERSMEEVVEDIGTRLAELEGKDKKPLPNPRNNQAFDMEEDWNEYWEDEEKEDETSSETQ